MNNLTDKDILSRIKILEAKMIVLQESWARIGLNYFYDAELENTERYLSELLVEARNRELI